MWERGGGREGSGREEVGAEGGRIGESWWEREGRVGGMRGGRSGGRDESPPLPLPPPLFLLLLILFVSSPFLYLPHSALPSLLVLFCTSHSPSSLSVPILFSFYFPPLPSHLIFFLLPFPFSRSPPLPSSPPPPPLLAPLPGWGGFLSDPPGCKRTVGSL